MMNTDLYTWSDWNMIKKILVAYHYHYLVLFGCSFFYNLCPLHVDWMKNEVTYLKISINSDLHRNW